MLLGSMLNNAESWINITTKDLETLKKPDTMLHRNILSTCGNPSKVFMCLELGLIPVNFVIMEKRLSFLRYILTEPMNTMIRQVYEELKNESRKGDFVDLVRRDMDDLNIELSDDEIKLVNKSQWKKYVHEKVKETALNNLLEENETKTKTKHIQYDELKMRGYLTHSKSTSLSKIIFSVRSGTLDIKTNNDWKYDDDICVMCKMAVETMEHFMICETYGKGSLETDWTEIYSNDAENLFEIAKEIRRRKHMRNSKINEDGLPPILAPLLQIL